MSSVRDLKHRCRLCIGATGRSKAGRQRGGGGGAGETKHRSKHLSGRGETRKYYGKSRRALGIQGSPFFTKGSFALADFVGSKEKRGSGIIVTARLICCRGLPANGACQAIGNSLHTRSPSELELLHCSSKRPTAPTVGTGWDGFSGQLLLKGLSICWTSEDRFAGRLGNRMQRAYVCRIQRRFPEIVTTGREGRKKIKSPG